MEEELEEITARITLKDGEVREYTVKPMTYHETVKPMIYYEKD